MNIFTTKKKMISSLIATLAISSISLNAADYGSVNGDSITKDDIAVIVRKANVNFDELPKKTKDRILDQVIEKKLLSQKALKSGIEKEKSYKEALDKLKADLALEMWMKKEFKKVKVSDKEQKDFYDKNKSKFKTAPFIQSRHILTATEAEAKGVIKELDKSKDKKAKFIELAKSKSTGPSAPRGGFLGKVPAKNFVPEFSNAAMALNKGAYTKNPVKTKFGYHVIMLEDKGGAEQVSFDKAKANIKQMLVQNKFNEKIKKELEILRKKAKIVIK